ncbi:MAG: carboxypeptidase-like regulatory domain-containing protein [Bacteroidota bacterium]
MNNNDWLDIDVLEDYLDGKLDAKAMHRIERLSLEDPFVAEALAGLSLSPKRVQSLSLLQKQLQDRIAQKPVQEKRWQITSQRLSIAAASAVLFVTVSLLFWMRESNNREQLAASTPKKVEAVIAPVETTETPKIDVEKVIADSKGTTYASNSRKTTKSAVKPAASVIAAAPTVAGNEPNVNEGVSLQSIEVQKKNEVLDKSFSSALAGKVAGVQINRNLIRGTVYGEDKVPIPGASIKLKGASNSAITDGKGEFNLMLDSLLKNPKLSVAFIGYVPKEVSVKKDQNLAIELKADNTALNEVVITGAGTKQANNPLASKLFIRPEPADGWGKFEEYVLNNNKLLIDKKVTGRYVTINFDIDKDGKPINIKAAKRFETVPVQTEAEEKEAIRLVQEGPKWILPSTRESSSTSTFVNIRF